MSKELVGGVSTGARPVCSFLKRQQYVIKIQDVLFFLSIEDSRPGSLAVFLLHVAAGRSEGCELDSLTSVETSDFPFTRLPPLREGVGNPLDSIGTFEDSIQLSVHQRQTL